MNADDTANGKNYKCMLKVMKNRHINEIYYKTKIFKYFEILYSNFKKSYLQKEYVFFLNYKL